jgi:predicted alpha/beta-hydrolase family hydrolase
MNRSVLWRRIRRIWVTLGLTVLVVFVAWSALAYRSSAVANRAAHTDPRVSVTHSEGAWFFKPTNATTMRTTGLLFFAGALVDPRAYAPMARAVAEAGFVAVIVELPRRGAFGGADDPALLVRARGIMRQSTDAMLWVVGGHSRGAVVACNLAAEGAPIAGLVLVGTSHPRDVDLSRLSLPVTKIVGTRDGLASEEEVKANQVKLPPHTRWVWIEGGNHSQFGWYGFQPGDSRAHIPRATQQRVMTDAILVALAGASNSRASANSSSDSSRK